MYSNNNIPKEFIPLEAYIVQTTLAYISFSIPNTKENYDHFLTLIEPELHPSIVEIQQLPDPSENIFIRITVEQAMHTPTALLEELLNKATDILDAERALREVREILDKGSNR